MSARGWLFRVASVPQAGGGHVQRCRFLAHALADRVPVTLCLDPAGEAWRGVLSQHGLSVVAEADALTGSAWDGVVLDSYAIGPAEAKNWRQRCRRLVQFDDFLSPLPGADLVINAAPQLAGQDVKGVPALLGADYAIVDPAYAAVPPVTVPARVERVMVSFGMRDSVNATGRVLTLVEKLLEQAGSPEIVVALGARAQHREAVKAQVGSFTGRIALLDGQEDLIQILPSIDMVIGGGGVSLLERVAAGVPSITIALNDNQSGPADGAAAKGATRYVGTVAGLSEDEFVQAFLDLCQNQSARSEMQRHARALVDGRGAERASTALLKL